MSDLIDRQSAIEALLDKGQSSHRYKLGETWELNFGEIKDAIESVPSAQPDIIRCKDCKYWRWRRLNGEEAKTLDEWDKEGMWIDYVLERGEDSDVD